MHIVYNCGYKPILKITGPSGKEYSFKKRYATKVADEDSEEILNKTSSDVQWCPQHSRSIPPFMELEAWCRAEAGRFEFGNSNPKQYDPKEYLKLFSIENE